MARIVSCSHSVAGAGWRRSPGRRQLLYALALGGEQVGTFDVARVARRQREAERIVAGTFFFWRSS